MIKIYHNPRCKKSRAGLKYLEEHDLMPEIIQYIKYPVTEEEFRDVLEKLGKEPEEIVRKQEEFYKKNLKGKELSRDEWIEIMVQNPKLIQRPIVVKDDKAVIADPPSNIEKLLDS